jgi:hypothetical protein
MAHTDERIETLRQAISELTSALETHMVTHNTGGSIIDRQAPAPLARARELLDDADDQCPC